MLTSIYAPTKQAGNGVIVAFNFSFKILATTDLLVYKIDAAGVQGAALALGVDFTATFDPIAETGTVTYTTAPVTGGYSLIDRSSNNQQQTSLPREGPLPAKTVETMIDKVMMVLQELQGLTVPQPIGYATGLIAARPASYSALTYYYATDDASLSLWVPAAARWFLLG